MPNPTAEENSEPNPVGQNIDAIADLHASSERQAGSHQRAVEAITNRLGRPWLLYVALAFVLGWVVANLNAVPGVRPWDKPPFNILQGIVSLTALFVSILVLITQNRQGRVAQRRSQLDLHIGLVIDQRCAKIIQMMEEVRKDSPFLKERDDPEIDVLKTAVDAQAVASDLESRIEEMMAEREDEDHAMTSPISGPKE